MDSATGSSIHVTLLTHRFVQFISAVNGANSMLYSPVKIKGSIHRDQKAKAKSTNRLFLPQFLDGNLMVQYEYHFD